MKTSCSRKKWIIRNSIMLFALVIYGKIIWYAWFINCDLLWALCKSSYFWLHAKAVLLSGTSQLPHLLHVTHNEQDYLFWTFFINLACFCSKPFMNWQWFSLKKYSCFLNGFNNKLDHSTQSAHQPFTNNVLLIITSGQISLCTIIPEKMCACY